MTTYYKWTAAHRPICGDGIYTFDRAHPRIDDDLQPAAIGYHYASLDQLPYLMGTELWTIDPIEPPEIVRRDVCIGRTFAFVRQLRWSEEDLLDFAHWCLDRADHWADLAAGVPDGYGDPSVPDAVKHAAQEADDAKAALDSAVTWPQDRDRRVTIAWMLLSVASAARSAAGFAAAAQWTPNEDDGEDQDSRLAVYTASATEANMQRDWIIARLRKNGEDI